GVPGSNSDGHAFFPDLGVRLRETVLNPRDYPYGIRTTLPLAEGLRVAGFVRRHRVRVAWCDASVFHRANEAGRLVPLIERLRERPVVVVGPAFLRRVEGALVPVAGLIEVPEHNCWLEAEATRDAVLAFARRL